MNTHTLILMVLYVMVAAVAFPFLFIYMGRWRELGKPVLKLPINRQERDRMIWFFVVLVSQILRTVSDVVSERRSPAIPGILFGAMLLIFFLFAGGGFREKGFATYFGRIYPWDTIVDYEVLGDSFRLRFHDEKKYDGSYESADLPEETLGKVLALLKEHGVPLKGKSPNI